MCVNWDGARHFQVVGRKVLVSVFGSSGGPPRSVPIIADGHGNEKSGIRAAPNKKALSQGLYFSVHLSLLFVNKTTSLRSTFLDSTCELPKGLAANAPVPASNGHC